MNRGKDLIFNTIIIAIGKFSTQLITILLLPIYTSILSTEEYGIYDLIITITTFLLPFITLLMEESMFRFLIDAKSEIEKKQVISQTVCYTLASSIVFSIIILIIGKLFHIQNTTIFLIYLLTNLLVGLRNAVVRGMGKIKLYSISNFITSILVILLNIVFIVWFKYGYYGLLYSAIIANTLVSIVIFIKVHLFKYISFKSCNKKQMQEMVRYSIPLVPNSISWAIINLSDRIVISNVLGTSANGVYSMSYKFPNVMDTVYNFFYTAWKESAAKAVNDTDSIIFYNKIYTILKQFLYALVLGIIAFMPFVFPILIKNEFTEAYLYIPVLLLAMYFNNISGFYGGIFSAYKDTKIMGKTTIISAIINLVVDIILIKFIGIWAAAFSTLISAAVVYLLRKHKLSKIVKLKEGDYALKLIMFAWVMVSYYTKNIWLQIATAMGIALYCIYTNKDVLQLICQKAKTKIKALK
ncbi:MAG: oligosaccharide flippase family protein [Clostridia bacterium]|jgi:O-antigen/teichoic acid export membrane protein|nr:oligosaccharide flippase family protein [Clostridia bacterium]